MRVEGEPARSVIKRRSATALVTVALVGLSLAGCGSPSAPVARVTALPTAAAVEPGVQGPGDGTEPVSAAQRAELADGTVTHDEYVAAFQRMRSCIQADGYELLMRDEVNQVIGAAIPDAAEASYNRCYPLEFSLVDATWQGYREQFGAEAKAMADCLTERGKTPGVTVKEKYEQLSGMGIDPYKDCVNVKIVH